MNNPFNELMKRVKTNLDVLHSRLVYFGYEFTNPQSTLLDPSPEVDAHLIFLEEHVGTVPLALAAFYKVVGSVVFTGSHPEWTGCEYPDPIVIEPVENAISEAKEFLELESPEEYWASDNGIFRIPIAPDYYHKENVSGGMWYGVEVPNQKDNPDLLEEWHQTTFVEYLRLGFEWGGFPGLERAKSKHTWPLTELKKGLRAI